jgi:hypothetical protein
MAAREGANETMCCLISVLVLIGPRFGLVFWYLYRPDRFDLVFDTWVWPILGFLLLPWTTVMYVAVGVGGVDGWDWLPLAFGFLLDLSVHSSSGAKHRERLPAYSR